MKKNAYLSRALFTEYNVLKDVCDCKSVSVVIPDMDSESSRILASLFNHVEKPNLNIGIEEESFELLKELGFILPWSQLKPSIHNQEEPEEDITSKIGYRAFGCLYKRSNILQHTCNGTRHVTPHFARLDAALPEYDLRTGVKRVELFLKNWFQPCVTSIFMCKRYIMQIEC